MSGSFQSNEAGWSGYDAAFVVDALASPGPFNVPDRIGSPLSAEIVGQRRSLRDQRGECDRERERRDPRRGVCADA